MEAGCEVVVVGSSASALSVAEEFRSKGFACHGLAVDLSQREQRRAGFAQAVELLGGHLDILVNGAGIQRRHFCEEFPIEDWDAVLEVNLTATFDLCQMAGQQFIRQNSKGKIINIASMLSFFGGYTVPAYAASKGGVAPADQGPVQRVDREGDQCERHRPRLYGHRDEYRPAER